jgi:hypothetical protein
VWRLAGDPERAQGAQALEQDSVSSGPGPTDPGDRQPAGGAVDSRTIRVGSKNLIVGSRDALELRASSTANRTPSATISWVGIRRVVRTGDRVRGNHQVVPLAFSFPAARRPTVATGGPEAETEVDR